MNIIVVMWLDIKLDGWNLAFLLSTNVLLIYESWFRGKSKHADSLFRFSSMMTIGLAILLNLALRSAHGGWYFTDWAFFGLHLTAAASLLWYTKYKKDPTFFNRTARRIEQTSRVFYVVWNVLIALINPNNPYRLIARADKHRLNEEWDAALADLNRVIARHNLNTYQNTHAFVCRGETYQDMAHYDLALADFNWAIEIDPKSDMAFTRRGGFYQILGQYAAALADFNQAIELNAYSTRGLAHRGLTYRQLGDYDKALLDFDRAIALDENYDWAIAHRGVTYRDMGDYDKALADLDRAIQLNSTADWYIQQRGQVYWRQQKFDLALADLSQTITLSPDDPNAHAWHAFVLRSMNRPEEAEQSIANALAQPTPDAYTRFGRAAAFTLAGEFGQAIATLKEVLAAEAEFRDDLRKSPIFDSLRKTPEYEALLVG